MENIKKEGLYIGAAVGAGLGAAVGVASGVAAYRYQREHDTELAEQRQVAAHIKASNELMLQDDEVRMNELLTRRMNERAAVFMNGLDANILHVRAKLGQLDGADGSSMDQNLRKSEREKYTYALGILEHMERTYKSQLAAAARR